VVQFCNNIQLNRVLPVGPREYWQELAEEHRTAPEHKKWQYDPDPFAAKATLEERQRRAADKRDKPQTEGESDLRIFDGHSDVRMATALRDQVESAIKNVSDYESFQTVS
jgi:ATP-dependent RNA helicase DHX57